MYFKRAMGKAVRTLRGTVPDLIILDVRMPEMNGFQLLELMRQYPKAAAIPVIMLSALSQPENIDRALSLGVVDYLVKPLDQRVAFKVQQALRAFMALPKRCGTVPIVDRQSAWHSRMSVWSLSRVAELWISAKVVWRGGPKAHPKSATSSCLRPMSCSKLSGLKTVFRVRVVYVRSVGLGYHRVGTAFIGLSSDTPDAIRQFIDQQAVVAGDS